MASVGAVGLLLLLLAVVGTATAVLAARHRLAFRIGMRNVRRGRGRTVLLLAGLLVATTIVSGSLVVGSTVEQLAYHYTYLGAGYVDEAISTPAANGGRGFFPYATFTNVAATVTGERSISGVAPEIIGTVAAKDTRTGIPDTNLNLIGVNGNQSTQLGSFLADNGSSLAGAGPNEVLLDDQMAAALNATVGDSVVVYGVVPLTLTVQAVVQENVRGAFITGGLTAGNLFVDLAAAQQIENASGAIDYIAITNAGSQAAGAAASTAIAAGLNVTLGPLLSAQHLVITTPLQTSLDAAQSSATNLETLFLVLGLFSIVAGAMLIIGIFVMLAEERKGETGVLRAIGLRRRELVYSYLFEGVAYAAGSAAAGTVLGVGVGFLLADLAGTILRSEGIPAGAIVQSFTVTGTDLVAAYVVGFLLTLVTVIVACRRASRLNIVRAIRDIPEPRPAVRTYTWLAVLGAALAVLGVVGLLGSYRGTTDLAYPIVTGAMVIVGVGLVAARFVANRYAVTGIGLGLAVWTGTEPLHVLLFGSSHGSSLFNLFILGILLIGGTLLVVLPNADLLVRGLRTLAGPRGASSPVVRVGTSYPARQPGRTAVSLTIFSLVVFTLIATAGVGSTLQGSLDATIADQSGGYTFFGFSTTPLPGLWTTIQGSPTLAPLFSNAVPLVVGEANVNVSGFAQNPYVDTIYAPPTNATGNASFYATNHYSFEATLAGATAGATFARLATNASVAVVDESYANLANSISVGSGVHPKLSVGTTIELSTLPGHRASVLVIGILTETILGGVWLNPAAAAALGYTNESGYLLTVAPGASASIAAQEMKRAFFTAGLVLFDMRDLLATSVATTEGFIGLLEIFVGLGLGVGIAAMGIFALRAMVERRREIGMLRATGFTRAMLLRSLFLEYSFVTLLGVAIGVGLGLLTVYNLSVSPSAAAQGVGQFVAPWATVIEVGLVAYALVLLAIAAPSMRAARLPPAEAVRSAE